MTSRSPRPTVTYATADMFAACLPPLPALAPATPWRRYHFDSLQSVAALVSENQPAGAWHTSGWRADSSNWRGAPLSDARGMAQDGWQDGAEQAIAAHATVRAVSPQSPRLARYDVAGAVPNIARALSGNPLAMRRVALSDTARYPVLTLVCDVIQNCELRADDFANNAIAQAAIVDMLEGRGYRCHVLALARTANAGSLGVEICTQVKAPEQSLSLAHAVFALGHPAYVRRLLVCILGADRANEPLGYGLGRAQDTEPNADRPDLFVLPRPVDGQTPAERFVMMLRALRKQKCPGIPDETA